MEPKLVNDPVPEEGAVGSLSRRNFLATSGLALLSAAVSSPLAEAQERRISMSQLAQEVMPANVRIFVHGEGGPSSGSGTLVNTPEGFEGLLAPDEVLLISAGHVYHDFNEHTRVEAQVFTGFDERSLRFADHVSCEARCIGYRSEVAEGKQPPDIAVLAVKVPKELRAGLKTVDLTAADHAYEFGDRAVTIGCPGGGEPVWLEGRVLSFTKASEKLPANIRTIAKPEKGHSGGGLFDTNGKLIGVCSSSSDVTRGTIDFPVPALEEKELIVSSHPFKPEGNQVIFRSVSEMEAYRRRMTPDWAEFATGRGNFVSVPDVHQYLKTLISEYETAKEQLAYLESSYERLQANLESSAGNLKSEAYKRLRTDLQTLGERAIEEAKKEVSRYRPIN